MSCEWNLWQTEDCSVSCGEGTQTKRRTKTTNNESPIRRCSGESVTKVPCNVASCPGKVFSLNLPNMHVLFICQCTTYLNWQWFLLIYRPRRATVNTQRYAGQLTYNSNYLYREHRQNINQCSRRHNHNDLQTRYSYTRIEHITEYWHHFMQCTMIMKYDRV